MFTVLAQATGGCAAFQFGGCSTVTGSDGYLTAILSTIVTLGWVVAAIFLAVGAIEYITSAGDTKKAESAKTTLTNALIGIVILLLIGSVLTLVGTFFTGGTTITVPTAPTIVTP
jgi:hypothetical protein